MPDIWNYFKNLFRKEQESSPSQPYIHEMIERTEEEKSDYEQWKETLVRRRLQDWLNDQYALFRMDPDRTDQALDFLDTPSSKGFVIHFHETRFSERDVVHFFDFLKEQVLHLNYSTQISDLRTYSRSSWVETVQRHYLKPKKSKYPTEGKFHQSYGNVMIECTSRDDQVYDLKFRATVYQDSNFHDPAEFKDLMGMILV